MKKENQLEGFYQFRTDLLIHNNFYNRNLFVHSAFRSICTLG